MSVRTMDAGGRWRSKTVSFRISPEEDALLEAAVRLSGLTKQEYIISRLQDHPITVQANSRIYKALHQEFKQIQEQLELMSAIDTLDSDLLKTIQLVTQVIDGMKQASEQSPKMKGAKHNDQAR